MTLHYKNILFITIIVGIFCLRDWLCQDKLILNVIDYTTIIINYSTDSNSIRLAFIWLVILISSSIIVYSAFYITKINLKLFLLLINLFCLRILFFISSTNLLTIILGWDGLGVVSFFLVFFFSSNNVINPSLITIFINRIGDVTLIASLILINESFFDYNDGLILKERNKMFWFFFLLTTLTKSAQFPFAAWLPAAIAAPTPTSALVHSSTLVTAGVFLLIQYSNYFSRRQKFLLINISLITLIIASFSTIYNWDLKKLVALSTLRQLRIMFIMLLSSSKLIIINHLLNHAVFKALLFISVGYVMYNRSDNQDIRYYRAVFFFNPRILISFLLSIFGLIGLPYRASFFSKHYFLDYLIGFYDFNFWLIFLLVLIVLITIIYSFKLLRITINIINVKTYKWKKNEINFCDLSLYFIRFLSIFSGLLLNYWLIKHAKIIFINQNIKILLFYLMIDSILICFIIIYKKVSTINSLLWYSQITTTIFIKYLIKILSAIDLFQSWRSTKIGTKSKVRSPIKILKVTINVKLIPSVNKIFSKFIVILLFFFFLLLL